MIIKKIIKRLILIKLLSLTSLALAGVSLDPSQNNPASDLSLSNSKILTSFELTEMQKSGQDISLIDPIENDIWKKNQVIADDLFEGELESFRYVSSVMSRLGNFRFNVQNEADGDGYIILASKKAHNTLLRASILKKLGYRVPKIQHLKKITLTFNNSIEKKTFLNELSESTFGASSRWVIAEEEESVTMQDLVIMEANPSIYNLALGSLPGQIIKGRRVLNSLLVPYALTDLTESINLFSVQSLLVQNNAIHFQYEDASGFYPSLDDIKWMTKRIASLTASDLNEIVEDAALPLEVARLVFEKLKCRRDDLISRVGIDAPLLGCTPNLTLGEYIQDGKLTKENFDGFASRFTYGDPESPLKLSEIWAYLKSKAISNLISNATSFFNDNYLKAFDLSEAIYNHRNEVVQENFNQFIATGEMKKIPFGAWATPILNGALISSREIILGSYMGVDHMVQLADTVGIAAMGGFFIGVDGTSLATDGSIRFNFSRTYTHLTPVKSMKRALKEPFKNLMVNLQKRGLGHIFDDLEGETVPAEEKEKRLLEMLKEFKKSLGVGESIMIADNLIPEINWRVTLPVEKILAIQSEVSARTIALKRLHIYRKDENTLQIYKDGALVNGGKISLTVKSEIPTITINLQHNFGKATVKLHTISLQEKKDDLGLRLSAIHELLLNNDIELTETLSKPFKITHHFKETKRGLDFLLWQWSWPNIADKLEVTHPTGATKSFYRYVTGNRFGTNFQKFAADSIDEILDNNGLPNLKISISGSEDPGRTLFGSSLTRKITFESELVDDKLSTPYLFINYTWNGWKKSSKRFKKLLKSLKEKYKYEFFHDEILGTTEALGLYALNFNINFYSNGINDLLLRSKAETKEIFLNLAEVQNVQVLEKPYLEAEREAKESIYRYFEWHRRLYFKAIDKNDPKDAARHLTKMFSIVENNFSIDGIIAMVGGAQNIFISARVDGFRENDENGDTPIVSHSFGKVSDKHWRGPIRYVLDQTGMTESEFFAHWIIGRL